jgi:hypothetical protein
MLALPQKAKITLENILGFVSGWTAWWVHAEG